MKKPRKKKKPSDADYVDNQQLYDALVEYKKKQKKYPSQKEFNIKALTVLQKL